MRGTELRKMIISHSHQLIFLKPRKVAGTSFEIALSKYLSEEDVITPITPSDERLRAKLGYRGAQHFRKPLRKILEDRRRSDLRQLMRLRRPAQFYNHIPAEDVRRHLGKALWDRYLKVSMVRNPWECVVSHYFYLTRGETDPRPFQEWCLKNKYVFGQNNEQYMIDGEIVIDHFIRYEALRADIEALEALRPGLKGLYEAFAPITAKSGIRPRSGGSVSEVFDGAAMADKAVRAFSAFEIDRFGYSR
jgi:Sulfotransferase family